MRLEAAEAAIGLIAMPIRLTGTVILSSVR
jgi:hypothetical protein